MALKIALAGNPNSGKTTLFNALTGANQFVGNWPGVTVEKKEGRLKGCKDVTVIDLPGIYSLSPYSLEELISRNYLLEESPDVILNIIDGTNLERNLFLTTQLLDLGIPVVAAVNMIDAVEKAGDVIRLEELGKALGCEALAVSALKGTGVREAAEAAVRAAGKGAAGKAPCVFPPSVEGALDTISALLAGEQVPMARRRFFALKVFERDAKFAEKISLPPAEALIRAAETERGDDAETIITEERYRYITGILPKVLKKKSRDKLSPSDRIDRVVTNRFAALPIFAAVIFLVYFISVTTVGTWVTDWTNECLFGEGWHITGGSAFAEAAEAFAAGEGAEFAAEPAPEDFGVWVPGIPVAVRGWLEAAGTAEWLNGLILDGIIAGVGAVLGFVPQMLVLFMFLAALEACGYMARIAFILDRIFRRFGLSGRSFIPMLIATGCGIPGVMASRTIENEHDRRMTVMTATFMPCGAKLPIIALISGAVLGGAWWVAPSAYFLGIFSVILSGIILKKTRMFAGDPSPFVMELPAYHLPTITNILRSMGERAWSFIRKAGTVILVSAVLIWFLSSFGVTGEGFRMVDDLNDGLLAAVGGAIAWIFAPLGFGTWDAAVATLTGLVAKENVVGTMGVLYGYAETAEDGVEFWQTFAANFTVISAYAFLAFNLLCAPCFAAIGAIRREMNNPRWTWFALGYQTAYAYTIALIIYQLGTLFSGGGFGVGTLFGFAALALLIYLLVRKPTRNLESAGENRRTAA
ncbi:MAG: ferrous iron transporter B [Spirochaetaceae bacterium]|jgi:ferrous iron transport protein B|nr:ferrous iron transporter B [Spirochaetaceae bacterium]